MTKEFYCRNRREKAEKILPAPVGENGVLPCCTVSDCKPTAGARVACIPEVITGFMCKICLLILFLATFLLCWPTVDAYAVDESEYRVILVPFNESVQFMVRQRSQYIEVLWSDMRAGKEAFLQRIYSIFIEHRGVRQPGDFNGKYVEYNIRLEHTGIQRKYSVLRRANYNNIRNWISESLARLACFHEYPQRQIIQRSSSIVLLMYELAGVIPRNNYR